MLKSSLLEILRTFTKQELIKFEDFVRSPYHNKKENVVKLFLEIKEYAPEFSSDNLEKDKIWVKVFPGKEYNYGIMKNLIHELTKLSESFITIEYSFNKKLETNIDLLVALTERQITKVFLTKTDMLTKIYNSPDLKNENYSVEEYYEFLYKLYYLKSFYESHHDVDSKESYETICSYIEYLIYSAVITFYKYYNNYLTRIYKKIPDKVNATEIFNAGMNNIISKLLENVKVKSEKDFLILKCFHEMNIAVDTNADINSYFNFKKSLIDCSEIIPKEDLRNLLICSINSLRDIKKRNPDLEINFRKEILGNFDLMIENNVFLESSGFIEGSLFIAYIEYAFFLKDYERIENLTKKFANKISEGTRKNDNIFSHALICYGKKEYNKSLEYLSKINYDYFYMKHMVKNIQILNYYELNDYISFSYVADSYRHFISKNRSVTSVNKSISADLCNSVNKLFKLRESFDKFELEKFRKESEKSTEREPSYKYWILDKISEIEKQLAVNS